MVVFDTTILIEVENGNEQLRSNIKDHTQRETISITTPTLSEYWYGLLHRPTEERKQAQAGLAKYKILNSTQRSAKRFAEIKHQLDQQGTPIPEFDMLIASIVQAHDETLITNDDHFKQLPQLETVLL